MKAIRSIVIFLLAAVTFSCSAQNSKDQAENSEAAGEIQVYYFHFSKRCATCNAVENETVAALDLYFSNQLEQGQIVFKSLNLEEDIGREMAQQLKISGQTLLLVKGEESVNLTSDGFMNARTKPEIYHKILKSNIEDLL